MSHLPTRMFTASHVQWDAQLGGTEVLPQNIHFLGHAAARSAELAQMHAHLSASASPKLAFQRIPHHMRRRAMSHNVRRLPRRLRDIHTAQMLKSRNGRTDVDLQAQMRRPNRNYRRKPANLIAEYSRRRANIHWLHTHIWHAKRFHMEPRWSWKIPIRPTARAYRANYRAIAKHCFIQDISFFSCVQLEGSQEHIINGLSQMSDISDLCIGTTNPTAMSVIRGNREGTIHVRDIKTRQAIGSVFYMWRPPAAGEKLRALWLWIHPAFYHQVMSNLHQVFRKIQINHPDCSQNDDYILIDDDNVVTIKSLRHELGRFRVRGPLATCVLQKALRSPHREQDSWWEQLHTTTAQCFSPRSVYDLLVTDPRLNYPRKRIKATVNILTNDVGANEATLPIIKIEKGDSNEKKSLCAPTSILWVPSFRHEISANRQTNATLANFRTLLLVPGTAPQSTALQRVPVILVQSPGSMDKGFASGWDLILPIAYIQPIWIALVLWGARVGGIRDSEHIHLEAPDVYRMCDWLHPDTFAGQADQDRRSSDLEQRYWAKPPNKRCNYIKLAIVSPFRPLWQTLLTDWLKDETVHFNDMAVLRDKQSLQVIAEVLPSFQNPNINKGGWSHGKLHNRTKSTTFNTPLPLQHLLKDVNCAQPKLIYVRLTLSGRGRCNSNALICLPHLNDWSRPQIIEEPLHSDTHSKVARKKLRLQYRIQRKLEKHKRRDAQLVNGKKEMGREIPAKEYLNAMRALWIPSNVSNVRNSCAREVIGWVTEAAYSFVCGQYVAQGYIVLPALPDLLLQQQSQKEVLVRDTQSRCYKFAQLQILLS